MDEALVEHIVRDVLRQYQSQAPAVRSAEGGGRKTEDGNVLRLEAHVVTHEILEAKLNGAKRIVVGKRTVLTPSAREFIKKNGVTCDRDGQGTTKTVARWKLIVSSGGKAVESVANELQRSSTFERQIAGTASEAAETAVSIICRGEADGVVAVSNQPETIACRANRSTKVRAAVTANVQRLSEIQQSLGANLYCVDPTARSYFELRNLLRAIAATGVPRIPAGWER